MLFVVDFDGTISKRDTIDQLLEKFADPSWEELEKEWLDGRMTGLECMSKQIDMVDSDLLSLENFFRSIQLDETFLPFYEHVKKFAKLVIASDGLDHSIKVATRQAGWPEIQTFSNRLNYKERGIEITFPLRDPDCKGGNGMCKCAVADYVGKKVGGPVVLIGDGKSDACLALHADIVFAKSSLIKHCEKNNVQHHTFNTFDDVLKIVKTWKPEEQKIPDYVFN